MKLMSKKCKYCGETLSKTREPEGTCVSCGFEELLEKAAEGTRLQLEISLLIDPSMSLTQNGLDLGIQNRLLSEILRTDRGPVIMRSVTIERIAELTGYSAEEVQKWADMDSKIYGF